MDIASNPGASSLNTRRYGVATEIDISAARPETMILEPPRPQIHSLNPGARTTVCRATRFAKNLLFINIRRVPAELSTTAVVAASCWRQKNPTRPRQRPTASPAVRGSLAEFVLRPIDVVHRVCGMLADERIRTPMVACTPGLHRRPWMGHRLRQHHRTGAGQLHFLNAYTRIVHIPVLRTPPTKPVTLRGWHRPRLADATGHTLPADSPRLATTGLRSSTPSSALRRSETARVCPERISRQPIRP